MQIISPQLADEIKAFGAIATPMTLLILFIFRSMIDKALRDSNKELLERINGTYLRTALAEEKFSSVADRFKVVHSRIDEVRGDVVELRERGAA